MKVRVPDDPSAIVRLKILGVETFCLTGLRQRVQIEIRWANERCFNSNSGKRRLGNLKQWGERLGKQ